MKRVAYHVVAPPRGIRQARPDVSAWCIVGSWVFFIILDSSYGGLVPMGKLLRTIVPLLFVGLLLSQKAKSRSRADLLVARGLVVFALAGLISSLLCVAPELGIIKLALYLGVMVPLLRSRNIAEAMAPGTAGFRYLCYVATALLVAAAMQRLVGFPGVLRNPNAIGGVAVLVSPLLLFELGNPKRSTRKWAQLGLLLGAVVVVASLSRGAVGSYLAVLVVYFGLKKTSSWQSVVAMSVGAVVLGAVLLVFSDTATEFAYKGSGNILDDRRQNMLDESLTAFREAPIFGYGFGLSWRVEREDVAKALSSGRLSWIVGEFGNSTLAILSGGGLALALAFAILLLTILGTAYQSLSGVCRVGRCRDFQLAMIAGIVGLLAGAQTEAWLMAPLSTSAIIFWLYCGLALHAATPPRSKPRSKPPRKAAVT